MTAGIAMLLVIAVMVIVFSSKLTRIFLYIVGGLIALTLIGLFLMLFWHFALGCLAFGLLFWFISAAVESGVRAGSR
jgi:hypothetical protein